MLLGIFMGQSHLRRGWSGALLIADCEDLENLSASEIHVKRFKRQDTPHKEEICRLHVRTVLKIFDVQHPYGRQCPAAQLLHTTEEDNVFEEKRVDVFWSIGGDSCIASKKCIDQSFTSQMKRLSPFQCSSSMWWGKREQASKRPPNTRWTISGMTREKSCSLRNGWTTRFRIWRTKLPEGHKWVSGHRATPVQPHDTILCGRRNGPDGFRNKKGRNSKLGWSQRPDCKKLVEVWREDEDCLKVIYEAG